MAVADFIGRRHVHTAQSVQSDRSDFTKVNENPTPRLMRP